MGIVKLIETLKTHWVAFLAAIIIVTPIVCQIASLYYQERIKTLESRVELLKDEKQSLMNKFKQPLIYENKTVFGKDKSENKSVNNTAIQNPAIRYPKISNQNRLTKDEVRNLAKFYDLFNKWAVNPHLRFKEGDISYWFEQGFSENDLIREFESRTTVLRHAEKSGEKILSQGDLSHKAQQLKELSR